MCGQNDQDQSLVSKLEVEAVCPNVLRKLLHELDIGSPTISANYLVDLANKIRLKRDELVGYNYLSLSEFQADEDVFPLLAYFKSEYLRLRELKDSEKDDSVVFIEVLHLLTTQLNHVLEEIAKLLMGLEAAV